MQLFVRGVVSLTQRLVSPHSRKYPPTLVKYCSGNTEAIKPKPPDDASSLAKVAMVEDENHDYYRERFIPLTRRSMIRLLMQEKSFLTPLELRRYEEFTAALDAAIVNRYHNILRELKVLYDGINPDADTIPSRAASRKERADDEFWLLQKLSNVMRRANFHELPARHVERALAEHRAAEGVMVSVDPGKYAVLKFWALGRETAVRARLPWPRRVSSALWRAVGRAGASPATPPPTQYYKRVVVAQRVRRHDKLLLKMFKEVPVSALEQLLPDGRVRMSALDHTLLLTTLGVTSAGLLVKLVAWLADTQVQWSLVISAVAALTTVRGVYAYKGKQNAYLAQLNRTLYFKNIANNRGLLALVVDRAEDEMLKEALLVYTFLLAQKAPSMRSSGTTGAIPYDDTSLRPLPGGLSPGMLETRIRDWIQHKTNIEMEFDSVEAVSILESLGLLSRSDPDDGGADGSELHVLPLGAACGNLPQRGASPTGGSAAATPAYTDEDEGFDTFIDYDDDADAAYLANDRDARRRLGWGGASRSFTNTLRLKFLDRLKDFSSGGGGGGGRGDT